MNENRLKQIAEENIDLMIRKNQAYSGQKGDNITATGLHGVAVRLMDKQTRLLNLTEHPENADFESIKDTLNDISNYALIGRLLEEGSWAGKPKMVYLAGPVDDVEGKESTSWRRFVGDMLGCWGISSYNPSGPYSHNEHYMDSAEVICSICRYAISRSDIILVNLCGNGRAFGTIREIEYAKSLGKRVIVAGPINYHAFSYDVEVVNTLDKAISLIVKKDDIYDYPKD